MSPSLTIDGGGNEPALAKRKLLVADEKLADLRAEHRAAIAQGEHGQASRLAGEILDAERQLTWLKMKVA